MDRRAYEETLTLLATAGFSVRASAFDEHHFGSWWIEIDSDSPARLVWDGKDGQAIIQRRATETDTATATAGPWTDDWISRSPTAQTPAALVREVRRPPAR